MLYITYSVTISEQPQHDELQDGVIALCVGSRIG